MERRKFADSRAVCTGLFVAGVAIASSCSTVVSKTPEIEPQNENRIVRDTCIESASGTVGLQLGGILLITNCGEDIIPLPIPMYRDGNRSYST